MRVSRAIQSVWCLLRPFARPPHALCPPRKLPEFETVNRHAGTVPVQPELSGLRLRSVAAPRSATRLLIQLGYRWLPSEEHRRRLGEMRDSNTWATRSLRPPPIPPPILLFPEDQDIIPSRLQPALDRQRAGHPFNSGQLPLDLGGIEAVARLHLLPTIEPRIAETDPEDLASYRHILPRAVRRYVRESPYPRIAGAVLAALLGGIGFLWVTQLKQAEAVAAGQLHAVRQAFGAELTAARAYGVDGRLLRQLDQRARTLAATSAPSGIVPSRARITFFQAQSRDYAGLLHQVHTYEKRALTYWTAREGHVYTSLLAATNSAAALGLPSARQVIPACDTPRCFRRAVNGQGGRIAWLAQTSATLRVYAAQVLAAPDPAAAAGTEIQLARNLAAVTPAVNLPVPLESLDSEFATAGSVAAYARAGALGHLDADALTRGLVRTLHGRALVISIEQQQMTAYVDGRQVFGSPITAGAATPTGNVRIQDKVASLAATYWQRSGSSYHYRYGSVPDWIALSSGIALQGAPWRVIFGPGSEFAATAWAPATPGSVDLPPAAAARIFAWAPLDAEVVIV